MSVEETKQVVEAFIQSSDECWLAETVQLTSPTRLVADGREAVHDALARLHVAEVVNDRRTQTRLVVADGIAAVEIRPRPTGHDVPEGETAVATKSALSAACFYEVADGEIVRASVHIDTTTVDQRTTMPNKPAHRARTDHV